MAKGNMILGYLRGAIGDIVFWRAKGQQMARARNRAPSNPRTEYQVTQRAKWANVAKFVKMAPPRFFKFAFESKGVRLTDYNVFYRENLLRSPMMSRTASANPAYPALGNFVLSRGSLPSIGALMEYSAVTLDTPFFKLAEGDNITIPADGGRTVAWLTNQLLTLAPSRYRLGDILTFVKISCNNFITPLAYPDLSDYGYSFEYYQVILSMTDTTPIKSRLGGIARLNTIGDNKLLGISYGSASGQTGAVEWSSNLHATCMIHTRNVSGGLLVSSEELTVNENYAMLTEQALTNSVYIQQVLTDWRAADNAILSGAATSGTTTAGEVTSIYNEKFGTTLTFSALLDAADGTALRLYVRGNNLSAEYLSTWLAANLTAVTAITVDYITEWEYDATTDSWVKAIGKTDYGSGTTANYTIAGQAVTVRKTT